MESRQDMTPLVSKFGLLGLILPYYSPDYKEWKHLIRLGSKKGCQTWTDNVYGFKTLYRTLFHKVMKYSREFDKTFYEYTLMNYDSINHSLEITLKSEKSYKLFIEFLDDLKKDHK